MVFKRDVLSSHARLCIENARKIRRMHTIKFHAFRWAIKVDASLSTINEIYDKTSGIYSIVSTVPHQPK